MNVTYSSLLPETEKDLIISQLKSQVFELEQNEKNFNSLNLRLRSIQSEANILSEEKLRLEYELKQKIETTDKHIFELRQTLENTQLDLSDKIQVNKKLFADNNNFYRIVESRNVELNEIKEDRNRIIDENAELRERVRELESLQLNDRSNLNSLRNQLDLSNRELEKALSNSNDLNEALKSIQNERTNLSIKNEEFKRDIANLNNLIRKKDESLSFATKNIDDLNNSSQAYKMKNLELEKKINQLTGDINQLNVALSNEKNVKNSIEKSNNQLELLLNEKDKENRKLFADNSELRSQLDKSNLDIKIYNNELEKLKSHIYVLTEQNQVVSV